MHKIVCSALLQTHQSIIEGQIWGFFEIFQAKFSEVIKNHLKEKVEICLSLLCAWFNFVGYIPPTRSQFLFEHDKQKWWEIWTIKLQSRVWQRHALILYIKNTSSNRCQLPNKESSHKHQRSGLSPARFNWSSFALKMSHKHLVSVSDRTPSERDRDSQEFKKQSGNCNTRGVCSNT